MDIYSDALPELDELAADILEEEPDVIEARTSGLKN